MTGRERTERALRFEKPDRAPRDLWALPGVMADQPEDIEAVTREFPLDFYKSELSPGQSPETLRKTLNATTYVDEWGSVWERGEPGVIGEVKIPALEDWSTLHSFAPPWSVIWKRDYSDVNKACSETEAFTLSPVTARPFERLQFLRGSEALYMDIGYDTKAFHHLLEIVHTYYVEDVLSWCGSDCDGIVLMDDWGTAISLLISPEQWRSVFKPLYRDYCDLIHDAGKYVFFHSDGFIEPIIGDLIEVGVDALNAQLFAMDIEEIARKYQGQITFWGEIDRQQVLPFGDVDDVKASVRRVRNALDTGSGGVIAQCEWGIANPTQNVRAVYEAWL